MHNTTTGIRIPVTAALPTLDPASTTGTPTPVTVLSPTMVEATIRTLVSMTTGTPIPVTVRSLTTPAPTVRTIHMPEHMTRMLELTIPTQVPTILTQERMTRTVRKIAVARNTISRSTIKIVDV